MTCRSHPLGLSGRNGIRRTIIVLRCAACYSSGRNICSGGTLPSSSGPLSLSRSRRGEEGKRDVLQITPVTSIPCIEAELRCRGFESVIRYIAIPLSRKHCFTIAGQHNAPSMLFRGIFIVSKMCDRQKDIRAVAIVCDSARSPSAAGRCGEAKRLSSRPDLPIECEFILAKRPVEVKLSGSQVTPSLLLQFHEPDDPSFYDLRLWNERDILRFSPCHIFAHIPTCRKGEVRHCFDHGLDARF